MTRNNRNRINQTIVSVPTEEILAKKFHYEVNPISSGCIASRKMSTIYRRRFQSVGNNDKQLLKITE
jgi:hypothetical protein